MVDYNRRQVFRSDFSMKRNEQNDLELAQFVQQLTDHQAVIRGYIRTLIPNDSDIRDVQQNTNLVLWERRDTFEPGSNFKAWAFAIARFRAMEHRKKLQKENRLVFDTDLIELLDAGYHEKSADSVENEYRALNHCLSLLNARDRALIDARYTFKTPLAEYSRSDGRSESSLRVILNRLRTLLRDCMNKQLAGEGGQP